MECKLKRVEPLSPHVIKMVGYMQTLERLGFQMSQELATDTVLDSFSASYGSFISNYHMHGMNKKFTKLQGSLKTIEQDIKRGAHQVLMVQKTSKFKKSSWTKKNAKAKDKDKDVIPTPAVEPKSRPALICFPSWCYDWTCNPSWIGSSISSCGSYCSDDVLSLGN